MLIMGLFANPPVRTVKVFVELRKEKEQEILFNTGRSKIMRMPSNVKSDKPTRKGY